MQTKINNFTHFQFKITNSSIIKPKYYHTMNTLFVGRHLIALESVDSTNVYALALIEKNSCFEGTVIVAHDQKSGKGQRGNQWISSAGENLTISIVFKPLFLRAMQQFSMTKAIALGVRDFFCLQCKEEVKIKWPNDILISNKKMAGILIENILRGQSIHYSVAGLGINLNQTAFLDLPQASSLKCITGVNYDLKVVMETVFSCIEKRYLQLKTDDSKIHSEYLKNLFQFEQWTYYEIDSKHLEARIIDVTENGKLKMEMKEGSIKEFDMKELKFVY